MTTLYRDPVLFFPDGLPAHSVFKSDAHKRLIKITFQIDVLRGQYMYFYGQNHGTAHTNRFPGQSVVGPKRIVFRSLKAKS